MKHQSGFTIIELMFTIMILGISLSIAVPSFSRLIMNNRIDASAQELSDSVYFARSEAVKRKRNVRICPAKNDTMAECDQLTNWSHGWLLIQESNNEVLKAWQNISNIEITGPADGFQILASGMLESAAFPVGFEVTAPGCGDNQKRLLSINRIGSVSMDKENC